MNNFTTYLHWKGQAGPEKLINPIFDSNIFAAVAQIIQVERKTLSNALVVLEIQFNVSKLNFFKS